MNSKQYIKTIVEGLEVYFRTFALADNMLHCQTDGVEWIAPSPNGKGPAIVFGTSLDDISEDRVRRLMPDLQNGKIPALWVLSPLFEPKNVRDTLIASGFKDISSKEMPEYGMALDMKSLANISAPNKCVEVKKVTSEADFRLWINVVNTALHGWDLLTIEHYSIWLNRGELSFYLGYINGIPVSTAAAIQNGRTASLEFVSTLVQYRKQGAAYAVCLKTLQALRDKGIRTATLRSSHEGFTLYKKLGFKPYYEQMLLNFQKQQEV
ncbi:MAG TPA: GNAT family N-acetyltransferase [Clostridia bacterium]|nr:GNAT family N-acetyltransferase [Clostridia bacterium]